MTGNGSPEADRLRLNRQLAGAVRKNDIARIGTLIEAGADVNGAAPGTGYTPLMWAMSAEATRTLLRAGASVHARDRHGHTPLMWVISKNGVPEEAARIAEELIDAGADVSDRDHKGHTPLYWARHHRSRLREPRLRRIAEELVFILQATPEPERTAATAPARRRISRRARWIAACILLPGALACVAAGLWL